MRLLLVTVLLLVLVTPDGLARQTSVGLPVREANSESYQIGPGDLLEIRVFGHPELGRGDIRVGNDGTIRLPFIENDIKVNCLTERQIEHTVREGYRVLLKNPIISVFVKEYKSRQATVVGAVKTPLQVSLLRKARLLDLINLAGGTLPTAGTVINVIPALDRGADCDGGATTAPPHGLETIDRRQLESGDPSVNRYVRPGDTIDVPEAQHIFVTGNVLQPRAFPMTDQLTLTQVLAMAGGIQPATKKQEITILRRVPNSTERLEEKYDLVAIEKRRIKDPVLQENDVVYVPTSEGKKLWRDFVRTIVGAPQVVRQVVY